MSDIERKREALKGAYNGAEWRRKVRNMTPEQVIAVYLRLKKQSKVA